MAPLKPTHSKHSNGKHTWSTPEPGAKVKPVSAAEAAAAQALFLQATPWPLPGDGFVQPQMSTLPDFLHNLPTPKAQPLTPLTPHVPGEPLAVQVQGDRLHIGNVTITFMRTLRIPDDGRDYPLPPGLGAFPLRRVADYAERVPESWREHGGVFLPIYQREAMWLSFSAAHWRPNALKVAVGKVNALSGKPWSEKLAAGGRGADGAQDYMVVPDQMWLDGINSGKKGIIKQFVAMPLGMGYTVEGQVTGEEIHGGLQLCVFEPKSGRFPDAEPQYDHLRHRRGGAAFYSGTAFKGGSSLMASCNVGNSMLRGDTHGLSAQSFIGQEMGLAVGGSMKQSIYPDRHGIECWDEANHARVFVHLVNSELWQRVTGERIPETPVDARTYSQYGYPWFSLYDEKLGDIASSDVLEGVKSVKGMDEDKGFKPQQDDESVEIADGQVHGITPTVLAHAVADGDW